MFQPSFLRGSFSKLHLSKFCLCVALLTGICFLPGRAETPAQGEWGDNGNGSYVNPILQMDFSDLDAIRVGTDYYAISSTIQFSPGMVVLRSRDLVNWTMIAHVVPDLTRLDTHLNWDKMDQYGKGVWAGSLRYHDGKFWVYFNVPTTVRTELAE